MADDLKYNFYAVERGGVTYNFLEQAEELASRAFRALNKANQFAADRKIDLVRVLLPGGNERMGFFIPYGQEPTGDMVPLPPLMLMPKAIPKNPGWDRLYTAPCMGNSGSICCEVSGLEKSIESLKGFRFPEQSLMQSFHQTESELFLSQPGFMQVVVSEEADINEVIADIMKNISLNPFGMMQPETPEIMQPSPRLAPASLQFDLNEPRASAHKIWKGDWIYRVPQSEHAFVPPASKQISAWGAKNLAHPMPVELFRSDHSKIWPAIEAIRTFPERLPQAALKGPAQR